MKVIQVQGCFWHQHSGCKQAHIPKSRAEYWHPKLTKNKRRDRKNEKKLRQDGWDVLTIWECEVKTLDPVAKRIESFLRG
jgi:DNA mismatch endonuclease (patch repair protein)